MPAWLALTLLLRAVPWPPLSPTAIGAAEVSFAGVAAGTAAICRQVTGRQAVGHLAAGAALLASAAMLALLSVPEWSGAPGALADWTVPRAVLVAVAGVVLLQALVGPDVDSRSRPVRPLAIGLALSGVLWGLLIGAELALDIPAVEPFGGPAALLPVPGSLHPRHARTRSRPEPGTTTQKMATRRSPTRAARSGAASSSAHLVSRN